MESYVVRIYRRDKQDPQKIIGLVEMVESAGKEAFADFDELRRILSGGHENNARKKGSEAGKK